MLTTLSTYAQLFEIDNDLDELSHLILVKPLLNALVFDDFPENWYDLDFPQLQKELKSLNSFERSVVLGFLGSIIDNSGLVDHSWIHVPEIKWTKRYDTPSNFYSAIFNQIELPHGFYTGQLVSTKYPSIAAINTFVSFFGNPILNELRAFLNQDEENLGKNTNTTLILNQDDADEGEDVSVHQKIRKLIVENIPASGMKFTTNDNLDLKQVLKVHSAPGLLFLDEPKIYDEAGHKYWSEFLIAFEYLCERYQIKNPRNWIDDFQEINDGIAKIKGISEYQEAQLILTRFDLKPNFFPLFAWDFELKANDTLDNEFGNRFEVIQTKIDESDSSDVEKRLIVKKLTKEILSSSNEILPFTSIDKESLLEMSINSKSSVFYPFQTYYENCLEQSVSKRLIERLQQSQEGDQSYFLEGKTVSDLSMLVLVLTAGGYFNSKAMAFEFVSSTFKVEDENGLPRKYAENSIKKRLNEIANSSRKDALNKLMKKMVSALNSL